MLKKNNLNLIRSLLIMLIFYSMQLFLVTNSATATTFPSALSTSTAPPSAVAAASPASAATPTVSGLPVPSLEVA